MSEHEPATPRMTGQGFGGIGIVALSLASTALLGCHGDAERQGTLLRRDSAGLAIVTVTGEPVDTLVVDSPISQIGSLALNAAAEESFETITDLAELPDGRIAVVDNRAGRVGIYARSGDWRADLGGRGEGPGEFIAPLWVDVRNDTVFVWDARLRRLTAYNAEGDFAASWQLTGKDPAGKIAVARNGLIDEVQWGQLYDPRPAAGAVVRRSRSGVIEDTLIGPYPVPEYGWKVLDEESGTGQMINPPALAVGPDWVLRQDLLYVLLPDAARVFVIDFSSGSVLEELRLPRSARPSTPEDRRRFVSSVVERFGGDPQTLADQTEFADRVAAYARLLVDGDDRVWVSDLAPGAFLEGYGGAGWTVLDRHRSEVWRVVFPPGFQALEVSERTAYGTQRGDNGVQVVRMYPLGIDDAS